MKIRNMLFLGIDQHVRQLPVSLRDQHGDVILARQVSTQPEKILDFFDQVETPWNAATRRRAVPSPMKS